MKVRNKPCPDGRALGTGMARMADRAEQEFAKELGFVPLRCASCAFREGTFPNGCLTTVGDATKCAIEGRPFYCHHGMNGNGSQSVCAGWLLLAFHPDRRGTAPWPFSDETES